MILKTENTHDYDFTEALENLRVPKMKRSLRFPIIFFLCTLAFTRPATATTLIEECLMPPSRMLAKSTYKPSPAERPFFEKGSALGEHGPGKIFPESLAIEQGAYVSWFGIVRDIFTDKSWPEGKILMVQVLYADGFYDTDL